MAEDNLHPASAELEEQLRRLDTITDPTSRNIATDLIASVLQFHTAALERMLEILRENDGNAAAMAGFDRDPLVRSMLLIHDLHPDPVDARVRRAVKELEPTARKRDATVEVITAEEAMVRVRIKGGQAGRPLGEIVERAVRAAAPEAEQVIVEEPLAAGPGFVPLDALQKPAAEEPAAASQK
jgi:hypothetical protein